MRTTTYDRVWTLLAGSGVIGGAVVALCATPRTGFAALAALVSLAALVGGLLARGTSPVASSACVARRAALFAVVGLAVVGLGHLGALAVVVALLLLAVCPPVVDELDRTGSLRPH